MSENPTPSTEEKAKKPFYQQWWFIALIVLVVIIVIAIIVSSKDSTDANSGTGEVATEAETQETAEQVETEPVGNEPVETQPQNDAVPAECQEALETCQYFDELTPSSRQDMLEQLTDYEDFSMEAAEYALENCGADWKENALRTAKDYQEKMGLSPEEIYNQLVSEAADNYTEEEAQYAIDNLPK